MDLRFLTPLSPDEQLAHGLPAPVPMAMADRVRFSEIDILQHVNNKAYLDWFEALRVHYYNSHFRHHFAEIGAEPRHVVRNANIHYAKEMVLGETYLTTARVLSFRRTSYTMEQQIWSGDLRASMVGVMVFRTPDGTSGCPIPESLRQQFIDLDGATEDT
ncbi:MULTISPECIES: acyl-CoA thioesterase [unclassified Epibacterium]|uniref:acyl-CoA thioesterase n=1 Tax=unclassified Epibacterium TaxID=2639179 RepID=UPI001EF6F2E8|nr:MULTISPECIES: acyl-CoA thioesterase [unclassified Epibacterium]MCG7623221.1 acyl-CoA thioesterase [Epibacterium sp. Ofav1-8]MCG7626457.1 acyl-CoA thioesterase [Epibacterium sp. MM17-32]